MNVEEWVSSRTFHHSQFRDAAELAALKKSRGLTVSVCLPTLNEEKTVGRIIRVLKKETMDRVGLVDEIGIIDSGSTDRTREIAERNGAKVFLASECLPELGPVMGKGENLWKSLYLFRGDIILWIDADIRNIHPRFVYGLLGPLLKNPEIGYVKAFYRRPLRVGRKVVPGGGRVTELLVRPYLSLLFPGLSMLAQPLSGEYAGRRSVLERVPFLSGYGVEIGLLIDIEKLSGIWSIAQVDMDVRVHRNQDIESLRRMSYSILSALITRSEQAGKFAILEGLGHELHLVRKCESRYFLDTEVAGGTERPPMISVPAYQRLRGLSEEDVALLEGLQPQQSAAAGVAHLFRESLVNLDLGGRTKEQVLTEMTELLRQHGYVADTAELNTLLLRRERQMSTGIGHGIAIPHLITDAVAEPLIIVGRSLRGIGFLSSGIQRPVQLVFMILAPVADRGKYLEILSSLARLLKHKKLFQSLMAASTAQEAISVLTKYEALLRLQAELGIKAQL